MAGVAELMESSMLEQVVDAVRQVGDAIVMPSFLNVARKQKEDGSVLTEADLASQAMLKIQLTAIADCPMLGEEMTEAQQSEAWDAGADGLWCVDPIDGTSNFANGLHHFCISVAFLRAGRPVLGVVYAPATNEMFTAELGRGAYLNGQRLPLSPRKTKISEAIAEVDIKRLPKSLIQSLISNPPYYSQRNFGSCVLGWCYLAAGRFDLYMHGGQKIWDHSAGSLVAAEAGCVFSGIHQDDFWQGDNWQRSAVGAVNEGLHREWKRYIVEALK